MVSLGTNEGGYDVWIGLRGLPSDAQQTWQWTKLILDTTPPVLAITNPATASSTVSMPMIQVQGYANELLGSIVYDVSNAAGIFSNQTGCTTGQFYDTNLVAFTTNFFQCYDIALTNGLNTITVHAFDLAGNEATSNVDVTVDYSGDTTAPMIQLVWPTNGTLIIGGSFTLQAQVDDATATLTASIVDTNENTNVVSGMLERNGAVWFDGVPLSGGTNTVTVTATDAAGNVSVTNFNVVGSDTSLVVDLLTSDQLNQSSVTVTGAVGDPADDCVWVNGVQASVDPDSGDWEADGVPVSATGTAVLTVQEYVGDPVLVGTETVWQPQSANVVLMRYSYQDVVHSDGWDSGGFPGTYDYSQILDWSYMSGGDDSVSLIETYNHAVSGTYNYYSSFPAGDDGYTPTWEQYSFSRPVYYGADVVVHGEQKVSKETHVMIEPSGRAVSGAMKTYLVYAQVMDADSGLADDPTTVKIQGVPLTTDPDDDTWGEVLLTAPVGTTPEVTPVAAGSYTFSVQLGKTKEDWQQEVQQEIDFDSGVAIENYKASNGFKNNRRNIQATYSFYQQLFVEQPDEFYWAGLAKLAGAPVYAGLSDAEYVKDGFITSGFLTLDNLLDTITFSVLSAKTAEFQTDLIDMNIKIYQDLDWQFEAYEEGGLDALKEINVLDSSALDLNTITAWQEIDDGIQNNDDAEIRDGNTLLAQREQKIVLVQDYQNLNTLFPDTTSVMSILAQNPVLYGPSFSALEPGGDIGDTDTRWDWVSRTYTSDVNTGIFPLWLHTSDTSRLYDVEQPLLTRALQFSYVYNYINSAWTLY